MAITAPPVGDDWKADDGQTCVRILAQPAPPASVQVEAAGMCFHALARRAIGKRTISEDDRDAAKRAESDDELNNTEEFEEEEETKELLALDPLNWKKQDHYQVLGLSRLRWRATDEDLKRAFKRKVLKHHPDKKERKKDGGDDDSFFKCIQKAFEQLSDPTRRRAFDSVDPTFDDSIPANNKKNKEKKRFYEVFGAAFERNRCWSHKPDKAPLLGSDDATEEEVNRFYDYWYDFESWREFSYLDEEDTEKAENREEKRWLERQNKKKREERRKDEIKRLRKLVDNAYACDPRRQRFKDEKEEAKRAAKEAKLRARREEEEAERRAEEEKRLAAEKEEEAKKAGAAEKKKAREAEKKLIRKERKALRNTAKETDYFCTSPDAPDHEDQLIRNMQLVETLCETLGLEELRAFNAAASVDADAARETFDEHIHRRQQKSAEADAAYEKLKQERKAAKEALANQTLTPEESEILVKAVKQFPPGTVDRYNVIAEYINQRTGGNLHGNSIIKYAKFGVQTVMAKEQKERQAEYVRTEQEKKFEAHGGENESKETIAFDRAGAKANDNEGAAAEAAESASTEQESTAEWSAVEQKALEDALRKFGASVPDRWDRIAEMVEGKSKKECMKRFKELAAKIKAKKSGGN